MPDVPLASLAPQSPLQQQVAGFPVQAGGMIANALGLTDALKALRGEMTPEEAQGFALSALPGLIPGAGEAGPLMRGAEKLAPEVAEAAIPLARGIRAFHGSPYDFDKFDLSKVGTGEGAQAYGHGLYFAENPAVAGDYKSKLSTLANVNDSAEANTALTYLARNNYDKTAARADLERSLGTALPDTHRIVEAINSYNPGRMYEVNIAADPEHFLDWDKPLSEQPQNVKDIFAASGVHSSYAGPMGTRIESNAPLGELAKGRLQQGDSLLMRNLRQAGIPGIKYLDQGSRNAGQFHVVTNMLPGENEYLVHGPGNISYGSFKTRQEAEALANQKNTEGQTHNYVVFDDNLVDILKKYGLAGLLGGGGVAAMAKNQIPLSSLQQ